MKALPIYYNIFSENIYYFQGGYRGCSVVQRVFEVAGAIHWTAVGLDNCAENGVPSDTPFISVLYDMLYGMLLYACGSGFRPERSA